MYYSGIGSRETPQEILNRIELITSWLAKQGWHCRTGDAYGADLAFTNGCKRGGGKLSVYSPDMNLQEWWFDMAQKNHPAWHKCSLRAKKLHARNTPIILGNVITPFGFPQKSKFVVCWTKDGKATGGTGQGIRLANAYKIPVFNLYGGIEVEKQLEEFLKGF